MTEEPDNIVLRYLRRIDGKFDRLIDVVRDLKVRTASLEEGVVGVHRRLDRVEFRLDRIEKRPELNDAPV